jgi:hypothetical protein
MTRKQWRLDQIRAIEREYQVALTVVGELDERFGGDPSALADERLSYRDYQNFRANLESTYLIRLFAEFEAGLREAWEFKYRRPTHPKVFDLIESLAALCQIPQDWRDRTQEVRAYRNMLVHEVVAT